MIDANTSPVESDIDKNELCPFGCRCHEAAAEIANLRADAANWKRIATEVAAQEHSLRLEAERLRAALRRYGLHIWERAKNDKLGAAYQSANLIPGQDF